MREHERNREQRAERTERPASGKSAGKRKKDKKQMNPVARKVLRGIMALACLGIIACCVLACYVTVYAFDMLEDDQYILDLDAKRLE